MVRIRREDRLQILWAITFIMSGIIFTFAFWFTPIIGFLAVLGYIVLYVGLAVVFLMVLKGMEKLEMHVIEDLENKKQEIKEIKKALLNKYYKKRITKESYQKMLQDYERQLTEIEIRIKHLKNAI